MEKGLLILVQSQKPWEVTLPTEVRVDNPNLCEYSDHACFDTLNVSLRALVYPQA